ncbi:MAG: hypothetical protein QM820_38450 [Minicystis sp.]
MRQLVSSTSRIAWIFAAALISTAACGGKVVFDTGSGNGGNGGNGGSSATGVPTSSGSPTTTSGSPSTTSSGSMTSSGGITCPGTPPLTGACAPGASCAAKGSTCLAPVAQASSPTPGLRMSQITFKQPAVFTKGIVASVFQGAVVPSDPSCNLNGSGTLSWLLRFDLAAGTLTTGGAKPSPSVAGPYAFIDEQLPSGNDLIPVQPVVMSVSIDGNCTFKTSAADVMIPVFLDGGGTQSVILPLRNLSFHDSKLSDFGSCIGRYNAQGLSPQNSCLADSQNNSFLEGGVVDATMLLEDADHIIVSSLNESLCVLISQNPSQFGTPNAQGVTVCKRDANNQIIFKGDWCAATDSPAGNGCSDAVKMSATFAAQGVKIQ